MAETGNSNRISREYLDSLLIETRYMDSSTPDISFELYGTKAASPVMTAALSHLDHFMHPGAADALAKGAKDAGAILWYGMADDGEIERLAGTRSGGKWSMPRSWAFWLWASISTIPLRGTVPRMSWTAKPWRR